MATKEQTPLEQAQEVVAALTAELDQAITKWTIAERELRIELDTDIQVLWRGFSVDAIRGQVFLGQKEFMRTASVRAAGGERMMTSSVPKFRTSSGRKAARWGLVAALSLLLFLTAGSAFSSVQDGRGNGGAIPNPQSLPSSRTITYTYDAAGRLVSANYGGGAAIAYAYDAAGDLVGISPGGGYGLYLPLVLLSLVGSSAVEYLTPLDLQNLHDR